MKCLVTLNLNRYLSDNARASFLSASTRWRVDYVEVTTAFRDGVHPCYTKPTLFHRLTSYSRIAYFDADMLIRSDAPNPFELFSDDKFYAVKDISDVRFAPDSPIRNAIQAEAHAPWHPVIESQLGLCIPLSFFLQNFFNAGFMLCSPNSFRETFELIVKNIPSSNSSFAHTGRYEQALVNYAVMSSKRLVLVDEAWNYIGPDISDGRMNAWVYHFTGIDSAAVKPAISSFRWAMNSSPAC
jgi:hypothetical protein